MFPLRLFFSFSANSNVVKLNHQSWTHRTKNKHTEREGHCANCEQKPAEKLKAVTRHFFNLKTQKFNRILKLGENQFDHNVAKGRLPSKQYKKRFFFMVRLKLLFLPDLEKILSSDRLVDLLMRSFHTLTLGWLRNFH